jgi:hypothetical protein
MIDLKIKRLIRIMKHTLLAGVLLVFVFGGLSTIYVNAVTANEQGFKMPLNKNGECVDKSECTVDSVKYTSCTTVRPTRGNKRVTCKFRDENGTTTTSGSSNLLVDNVNNKKYGIYITKAQGKTFSCAVAIVENKTKIGAINAEEKVSCNEGEFTNKNDIPAILSSNNVDVNNYCAVLSPNDKSAFGINRTSIQIACDKSTVIFNDGKKADLWFIEGGGVNNLGKFLYKDSKGNYLALANEGGLDIRDFCGITKILEDGLEIPKQITQTAGQYGIDGQKNSTVTRVCNKTQTEFEQYLGEQAKKNPELVQDQGDSLNKAVNTDKANVASPKALAGALFGAFFKVVLIIVLCLLIIVEYVQMLILLIMTSIVSVLLNVSPTTSFLTNIGLPLWNIFVSVANLMMFFILVFIGASTMIGTMKSAQAIKHAIQVGSYAFVSNMTYLVLAFVIAFVDGFKNLIVAVFAGNNLYKLFIGLFAKFGSISDIRNPDALLPAPATSTFQKISDAAGQDFGVLTTFVLKESVIVIMFMIMIWIFKDTFILVLTRITVLFLLLITSPLLALAFLTKEIMPSAIKNKIDPLFNELFVTISFNLAFVISILLCFVITSKTQEQFAKALAEGGINLSENSGSAAAGASGVEAGISGLLNTVTALIPVFMGIMILHFVNQFYKENFSKVIQEAGSSVMKAASNGLQNFRKAENFGQGMAMLGKDVFSGATKMATGERKGDNVNLAKDIGGAAASGVAKTGLAIATAGPSVRATADNLRKKAAGQNSKIFGNEAKKLKDVADKNYNKALASDPTKKAQADGYKTKIDANKSQIAANEADMNQINVDGDAYARKMGYVASNGELSSDAWKDQKMIDYKAASDAKEAENQTLQADSQAQEKANAAHYDANSGINVKTKQTYAAMSAQYLGKQSKSDAAVTTLQASQTKNEDTKEKRIKSATDFKVPIIGTPIVKYALNADKIQKDLDSNAAGDVNKKRIKQNIESAEEQRKKYQAILDAGTTGPAKEKADIEAKIADYEATINNLKNQL